MVHCCSQDFESVVFAAPETSRNNHWNHHGKLWFRYISNLQSSTISRLVLNRLGTLTIRCLGKIGEYFMFSDFKPLNKTTVTTVRFNYSIIDVVG